MNSIWLPCVYYFFLAVVVIGYETTAPACWTLLFIVRAFFNNTITVAVWAGFHVCASCNGKRHVRFAPESGHVQCTRRCPLCAKSKLMHCNMVGTKKAPPAYKS